MDSSDEEDDIWDYKSLPRYRPSQVSRSFSKDENDNTTHKKPGNQKRKSTLSQPAVGRKSTSHTKFSTQADKAGKQSNGSNLKSRKSTAVKQEPSVDSQNQDTRLNEIKQKGTKKKQSRARKSSIKMETPVKREGRCPICQLPFTALSTIETPTWHRDQCQMSTSKAKDECPAGLSCESMIESHYRRFRHTEIARSSKKKSPRSQQPFGNVDGAKTCLMFDGAGPLCSDVVEEVVGETIVISSCSEDEKQTDTDSRRDEFNEDENDNSDYVDIDLGDLISDNKGDIETSAANKTLVDDGNNVDDNFAIDLDNFVSDNEAEETVALNDRTPITERSRESSNELPDIGCHKYDSDVVAYKESFENLVQESLSGSVKDIDASCDLDSRNVSDMLHDMLDNDSPAVRDEVVQANKTNMFEDIFSSDSESDIPENEEGKARERESKQGKGKVKVCDKKSVYSEDTELDNPDSEKDEEFGESGSCDEAVESESSESMLNHPSIHCSTTPSHINVRGGSRTVKRLASPDEELEELRSYNEAVESESSESLPAVRGVSRTVKRLASSDSSSLSTEELTLNFSQARSTNKKQKMESGKDSSQVVIKKEIGTQRVTRSSLPLDGNRNILKQANRTSPRKQKISNETTERKATQSNKIVSQQLAQSKRTTTEMSTKSKKTTPLKISKSGKNSLPKTTQSDKSALRRIKEEKGDGKTQTSVKSFFLSKAANKSTEKEIVIRTDSESEDEGCHGNHTKPDCCIQCKVASSSTASKTKQIKLEHISRLSKTTCTSKEFIKQEQRSESEEESHSDSPLASLSLHSLCTPRDANHIETRNDRSRIQGRDVIETDQESSYSDRDRNDEDSDTLQGGFFHDSEMVDEFSGTCTDTDGDKFTDNITGDATFEDLNPPGTCSTECNQSTISFVQTVTDKVSQITKNASDILMASSRLLSKKDSLNSDWKSKGQWGSRGSRGRTFAGPSRASAGATGGGAEVGASGAAGDVRRNCPFYKKIPDTCFTVDAFRYGDIPGCRAYILSHFHYDHYDHYGGLTKKFANPIYCSQITANLVQQKIRVDAKYLHPLPLDTPTMIEGVEITLIEANHCPGAVLILFRLRGGRIFLHTGDFRASPDMERHPALRNTRIHTLYLDITYCDPQYAFPAQEEVVSLAVRLVEEARARHPATLVVCGTYTIGKERIFAAIARALECKICVTREKKSVLDCLEDPELSRRLSLNWQDSGLHVLPMGKLKLKDLQEHLAKNGRRFDRVLAIEPTGWTHNDRLASLDQIRPKVNRDNVTVYGIPYSEHSSYLELKRFVQFTRPGKILATVNNGNVHSRRKMEVIFEQWTEEAARRS